MNNIVSHLLVKNYQYSIPCLTRIQLLNPNSKLPLCRLFITQLVRIRIINAHVLGFMSQNILSKQIPSAKIIQGSVIKIQVIIKDS